MQQRNCSSGDAQDRQRNKISARQDFFLETQNKVFLYRSEKKEWRLDLDR